MRSSFVIVAAVLALAPAASAQTVLFDSNGFEAPTYTLGNLIGQNGWTNTFTIGGPFGFTVEAPIGAERVVRIFGGQGRGWAWPTINYTPAAGELVRVQVDIAPSQSSVTNNIIAIDVYQQAVTRTTTFGLIYNSVSSALPFVDAPFNTTTGQFEPGQPIQRVVLFGYGNPFGGEFLNFDAQMDYSTKSFRLFLDGQEIPGPIPFMTQDVTEFGDAELFVESSSSSPLTLGYVDNYGISVIPVPEPATGLVVAAAGLFCAARWRRVVDRETEGS